MPCRRSCVCPNALRERALSVQRAHLAGAPDGLAGANAARARARDALATRR